MHPLQSQKLTHKNKKDNASTPTWGFYKFKLRGKKRIKKLKNLQLKFTDYNSMKHEKNQSPRGLTLVKTGRLGSREVLLRV